MLRKLWWMCIAATAPEYVLGLSASNFFFSQNLFRHLKDQDRTEWTLTHMQFAVADGFGTRNSSHGPISTVTAEGLLEFIETDQICGPPISAEELRSRSKSDWIVKTVAISQIAWFGIQTLFRAIQHFQTTALEIMTAAFVICSVVIYAFSIYRPQGVEFPVILELRKRNPKSAPKQNPAPRARTLPTHKPSSEEYPEDSIIPPILFMVFACGFGAIHCLGWNSPFPTVKERLAWHVCSVSTTALPLAFAAFFELRDHWHNKIISLFLYGTILCYVLGRITLIVLAFMALRALPTDAYRTVDWNQYIPHFGAA